VAPQPSTTRVMINTAAVLAVIGLAWVLIQIRSVMLLLIIGIIFAAAIEPLVYRLRLRGLSRGQAILTIYAGLLAAVALTVFLIVPPLVSQATELFDGIPGILDDLKSQALAADNDFMNTTGAQTITRIENAYRAVRDDPPIAGSTAVSWVTTVAGFLFTTVSVMIVAFYWMTEKAIIKRVFLGLIPLDRRDRAHGLWDQIERRIGGWVRGQLILMATIGIISAIAYFLMDLDFWLPLGIFAGLTEAVPFLGPFIGGGAAVMVALTVSWEKGLLVLVFVIVLQQLEGAVLVPRVMKNAVGMTPLTVVLAVLIGGTLAGPIGSILAIPVAAAVQVLVQDLIKNRSDDPDTIDSSFPVPEPQMTGTIGANHVTAEPGVATAVSGDGH
jgi:predicted PurR-regulated permease PerM